MGGCDKSTPALIMGATSMGLPFIYMPAGAMLRGNYAGEKLGSGTDVWKYWDERRAGNISKEQWEGVRVELLEATHMYDNGNRFYHDEHCRRLGLNITRGFFNTSA